MTMAGRGRERSFAGLATYFRIWDIFFGERPFVVPIAVLVVRAGAAIGNERPTSSSPQKSHAGTIDELIAG
jgi:hypothetical protein